MRPSIHLAREMAWVWALPLAIFLVASALFVNYQLAFSGAGKSLLASVAGTEAELDDLQGERRELEARVAAVSGNEERISELYDRRLATASERLTQVLAEVKELAAAAGLEPPAIAYGEDAFEEYSLVRRTFVFGVEGSYREVRRLIQLLEASESFLILEQIGLNEVGGSQRQLRINLRLSTLFAQEEEPS